MSEAINHLNDPEGLRIEAERINWTKNEFLSRVGYEIRTTMNAILGTSELQMQKDDNPTDVVEALSTIFDLGNLLLNNINDLLDISKIEDGELVLSPGKYDIPSLVNDTMQLSMLRFDSKPIEFLLNIHEDTPYEVYGDDHRVKQILRNLLFNAYQNTNRGRVELFIGAETHPDTQTPSHGSRTEFTLILRVSDTGYGLTEEDVKNLFVEFPHNKMDVDNISYDRGLGMSITKRLVDAMN